MMSGNTALKHYQAPFNFYWRPREVNFEGIAVIRCGNEVWALQFTIGPTIVLLWKASPHDLMNRKRGPEGLLAPSYGWLDSVGSGICPRFSEAYRSVGIDACLCM